jgi:hypothetical protein
MIDVAVLLMWQSSNGEGVIDHLRTSVATQQLAVVVCRRLQEYEIQHFHPLLHLSTPCNNTYLYGEFVQGSTVSRSVTP